MQSASAVVESLATTVVLLSPSSAQPVSGIDDVRITMAVNDQELMLIAGSGNRCSHEAAPYTVMSHYPRPPCPLLTFQPEFPGGGSPTTTSPPRDHHARG